MDDTSMVKKRLKRLFYIPYMIVLLISVVVFFAAGVPLIGWLVLLTILAILFFAKDRIRRFGLMWSIIFWIAMLVIILFVFYFSIYLSDLVMM